MNEQVRNIRIPVVYQGVLVPRTQDEIDARLYAVTVETDIGTHPRLRCKLCFTPGADTNFTDGTAVLVLVEMYYGFHNERYNDICYDGRHTIIGTHHPFSVKPVVEVKNINADLEGGLHSYLHPQNHAGTIIEDGGAVNIVTNGLVTKRMAPGGFGVQQHSDYTYAQNHHRVIMNQIDGYHWAREHFGLYMGKDVTEQSVNVLDMTGMSLPMIYRRFVPQSMSADYWVSTCEGTFCPWVGQNNELEPVAAGDSGILFSKVIHSLVNRITITAGKMGPNFFQLRVDTISPGTEKVVGPGPECLPVVALPKASINISHMGEFTAELGITPAGAAAIIKVAADGTVTVNAMSKVVVTGNNIELDAVAGVKINSPAITLGGDVTVSGKLDVAGPATSNKKNLATADVIDFLNQNLPSMYLSAAPGSPCVLSPAVIPLLSTWSVPGAMKTDSIPTPPVPPPATVTVATATLPLKST